MAEPSTKYTLAETPQEYLLFDREKLEIIRISLMSAPHNVWLIDGFSLQSCHTQERYHGEVDCMGQREAG